MLTGQLQAASNDSGVVSEAACYQLPSCRCAQVMLEDRLLACACQSEA